MCLVTKDPTIKTAEQDIIVYKELEFKEDGFFRRWFRPSPPISTIFPHVYKPGVVQPTVQLKPYPDQKNELWTIEEGYHSYPDKSWLKTAHVVNAMFIIPKGTRYIEGCFNGFKNIPNYVSETIIFLKKL